MCACGKNNCALTGSCGLRPRILDGSPPNNPFMNPDFKPGVDQVTPSASFSKPGDGSLLNPLLVNQPFADPTMNYAQPFTGNANVNMFSAPTTQNFGTPRVNAAPNQQVDQEVFSRMVNQYATPQRDDGFVPQGTDPSLRQSRQLGKAQGYAPRRHYAQEANRSAQPAQDRPVADLVYADQQRAKGGERYYGSGKRLLGAELPSHLPQGMTMDEWFSLTPDQQDKFVKMSDKEQAEIRDAIKSGVTGALGLAMSGIQAARDAAQREFELKRDAQAQANARELAKINAQKEVDLARLGQTTPTGVTPIRILPEVTNTPSKSQEKSSSSGGGMMFAILAAAGVAAYAMSQGKS